MNKDAELPGCLQGEFAKRTERLSMPRSAVLMLFVCVFAFCPPAAQCQNFQIGKISVCYNSLAQSSSACAEVSPPFEGLDKSKFSNSRLYVALTVVFGKDVLDFLKTNGVLNVNVAVWKDGTRKSDIPIGIRQDDWDAHGASITDVLNDQGSFPWRTRFNISLSEVKSVEFEITDSQKLVAYMGRDPARLKISFAN